MSATSYEKTMNFENQKTSSHNLPDTVRFSSGYYLRISVHFQEMLFMALRNEVAVWPRTSKTNANWYDTDRPVGLCTSGAMRCLRACMRVTRNKNKREREIEQERRRDETESSGREKRRDNCYARIGRAKRRGLEFRNVEERRNTQYKEKTWCEKKRDETVERGCETRKNETDDKMERRGGRVRRWGGRIWHRVEQRKSLRLFLADRGAMSRFVLIECIFRFAKSPSTVLLIWWMYGHRHVIWQSGENARLRGIIHVLRYINYGLFKWQFKSWIFEMRKLGFF